MQTIADYLPHGFGLWPSLILIIASFFTSALTASMGVGGGLAMLALMGTMLSVSALIPVHGAVQLGSNIGRAYHQRAHVSRDVLRPFALGCVLGAVFGLFLVVQLPDALLKLVLGIFVIAITWFKVPGIERLRGGALMLASMVLAVLNMIFGATGPLLSALFSQFFAQDRKALVATHAAGMTIQHALKVVVFAIAGFAFGDWLVLILLMVASGYLGTLVGSKLLDRLPEESFRLWFRLGITLLALDLLRQGAMTLA